MFRPTKTASTYLVGKVLDSTSRVVLSEAERHGARGFRKPVMAVALQPHVAWREPLSSRGFVEAAQHFAALENTGLLAVEDVGIADGDRPFAVAPLLRGRVLSRLFDGGSAGALPLSPRVALRVVARVALAAHALSERVGAPLGGLVAEAVWVGESGRIVLLPSVLCRGGNADRVPSDVHALGLLLWNLLALGRSSPPLGDATRLSELPLESGVVRAVMRALSSVPRERFVHAGAFAAELQSLANGASPRAPGPRLSVMPSPTRAAHEPAVVSAAPANAAAACPSFDEAATCPLQSPADEAVTCRLPVTPTVARLRCIRGGGGRQWMLSPAAERWVLGRSGASDFVVADPDVSRQHFEIVREPSGAYRVHDLGSKNGLFVNGAPVAECPLSTGDELRAGDTVLRFDQ